MAMVVKTGRRIHMALLCVAALTGALSQAQGQVPLAPPILDGGQFVVRAYRLVLPKTLPGATSSEVLASSGTTFVGMCNGSMGQGDYPLAVVWPSPGEFVFLAGAGISGSAAYGVNSSGTVVGFADFVPATGSQFGVPFVWRDGILQVLPPAAGTTGGHRFPRALNEADQIVGESGERAALWSAEGAFDLGTLGGATSSACDIDDLGRIVGTAARADGISAAALWLPAGREGEEPPAYAIFDLGTLGGHTTVATSINADGQIAGHGVLPQAFGSPWQSAFVWEAGRLALLETLEGAGSTQARAIGPTGAIVGTSGARAVLWTARGRRVIDLNAVTTNLGGWTLSAANDMDESGRIVGSAHGPLGEMTAFLLEPLALP